MKNNLIVAALTAVFGICGAVTFYHVWDYRASLHELLGAQQRAMFVRSQEAPAMNALVNDTIEYSKKNPQVQPILQALTNELTHAAAPKPGMK